jgi:hypothetical protein
MAAPSLGVLHPSNTVQKIHQFKKV